MVDRAASDTVLRTANVVPREARNPQVWCDGAVSEAHRGDAVMIPSAEGPYCPAGGFHVDPVRPVDTAVLTHAHADHARPGSRRYLAAQASEGVLRHRLGAIDLRSLPYGEAIRLGDATVSLHPASHVLGSAQVRIEVDGETWVWTGDYKRDADPTCAPFEPLTCDVLVTEATFGLPVYVWDAPSQVADRMLAWWRSDPHRPSLLYGYAFGKAQRLLAELAAAAQRSGGPLRPIYLHGAVDALMPAYREAGVPLPPTVKVGSDEDDGDYRGALVLAPPGAHRSPWTRRFRAPQTAFASGWMAVRGQRRRRGYEQGFVLSDHADWPGLLRTVEASGASRVYVTHAGSDVFADYLQRERGLDARRWPTPWSGEEDG